MNLFNNIIRFVVSLSTFDIIFFCAIILLIILVITMLYITNQNDELQYKTPKEPEVVNESPIIEPSPVVQPPVIEPKKEYSFDNIDLNEVTKALAEAEPIKIDMNQYETEQEEKAIISYEELLENTGSYKLNYEDEQDNDGISVKKVNLKDIAAINHDEPAESSHPQVISYAKEEAFLEALKNLQQLLN